MVIMTDRERRLYEGTGTGLSLDARIAAFRDRTASTMPVVEVCAWCDYGQWQTMRATADGCRVSLVLCEDCRQEQERES